jgi:hypothetical protein
MPDGYEAAVRAGTRTAAGEPGPAYWQQEADYRLTARLDTDARRLDGTAEIVYRNNSPDTLPSSTWTCTRTCTRRAWCGSSRRR